MTTAAPTTIHFSEDFEDFGFRKKKPKHTQAAARCTGRPDGFIYFALAFIYLILAVFFYIWLKRWKEVKRIRKGQEVREGGLKGRGKA